MNSQITATQGQACTVCRNNVLLRLKREERAGHLRLTHSLSTASVWTTEVRGSRRGGVRGPLR